MNRSEHLQWCKDRALQYVETGDLLEAYNSFMSDMTKHPETNNSTILQMGVMLKLHGHLSTKKEMIEWINGHN